MKVLMVDQFLPNSVYVVELCRELRKYAKITIFCKKNAGTDLDGVIWKDKLYAGGKGKMEKACSVCKKRSKRAAMM